MSSSDAVLWDIERDPVLRSTITAVALLDRAPDWDRLTHRLEYASRVIPRLRQRAVEPRWRVHPPRWEIDPDFSLDYHLRRVAVPAGGDLRELLDLAQPLTAATFDRARPLWEFTLVEGMAGGRAALIEKVHHTLTDGIGAVSLALEILDAEPGSTEPELGDEPTASATERSCVVRELGEDAWSLAGSLSRLPLAAAHAGWAVARDPLGSANRAVRMTTSIGRMIAPVPPSASPLLTGRGIDERFDTIEVPLADLRAAARAAHGTVNDALLAAVVEGLRRYHVHHGADVPELRLTMPINVRHGDEGLAGNHFAPARFTVPADIADPAERMATLGAVARRWRAEPALEHTESIAAVLDRLPVAVSTSIFGGMLKHVDAVVTNVPGFPEPTYLCGAEILRQYAFAPPTGAACNVSLVSHVDTACVGIVSDVAAIPDHDALVAALVEGFDDVLAVAGHHATRTG
jgi:WS/DGAT/MGAT family acyltransferase